MTTPFRDRHDAARRLADRLKQYRLEDPVVLGIPRGAVPMARAIADALDTELDLLLVHKVPHPLDPELAVAAVDEVGQLTRHRSTDTPEVDLERLAAPELRRLRERRRALAGSRGPVDLRDRAVILVDDGLATGTTMLAGIRSARHRGAARVILTIPRSMGAVGRWYRDFRPVSDEEVLEALERHAEQL